MRAAFSPPASCFFPSFSHRPSGDREAPRTDYFDKDVPQCGQLRQSLCTPRPQDGQVCPGAAELLPPPTFRTSHTTPKTASATRPTGMSHINIIPIQKKGLKPHPPIIPGPIIPQPPYLQPPSRLAAAWKTSSAIMVMTTTAVQLTFFIYSSSSLPSRRHSIPRSGREWMSLCLSER